MERKEGVGVEKRENVKRIRKKEYVIKREKKRERKESENYKTENGKKLVMKERKER